MIQFNNWLSSNRKYQRNACNIIFLSMKLKKILRVKYCCCYVNTSSVLKNEKLVHPVSDPICDFCPKSVRQISSWLTCGRIELWLSCELSVPDPYGHWLNAQGHTPNVPRSGIRQQGHWQELQLGYWLGTH